MYSNSEQELEVCMCMNGCVNLSEVETSDMRGGLPKVWSHDSDMNSLQGDGPCQSQNHSNLHKQ